MLGLEHGSYTALMIGSSNFTRAGMGVGSIRNAEANLLTVVERVRHGREPARLETVWEETVPVDDPSNAEWLGAQPELEEEEELEAPVMPRGFVAATYRAGDHRSIVLLLKPAGLPDEWSVHACGTQYLLLLEHQAWNASGSRDVVEIEWLRPSRRTGCSCVWKVARPSSP
jgi:hypothetical protein